MRSNDFPPWQSVSGYFRPWKKSGFWSRIDEKFRSGSWSSRRKA
ncbi:hypothetical protein CMK14_20290 [Candidatus Poribacteria bacterium]|nr:hypothetical protein [Candidatus Poribacteria bacterium]